MLEKDTETIDKELLDFLLENTPIGITLWNKNGELLLANQAFTRLTGFSLSDIGTIETWFIKAYPDPDYRKLVIESWNRNRNLTDTVREFKVTCKSGQVRDVEFRSYFLPDGRVLVTHTNISERKQDEDRLRYFKTAVERSSDAIGMSDPFGRHWYQNQAFDELFGSIGSDPPATLYVDETVGREVFETIKSGGQWSGEVQMNGKNGNILDILLRAYAIKNREEEIIGLVGTHTDITQQKEAEKALQDSEHKYRVMVDSTPDLLYRTDLDGLITFISASVDKLSGFTIEEAIGLKMAEEVYAIPEERQAFLELLTKQGSVKNFQARLKRKDGSIWWAATNAHFYRDSDGNIAGVEGVTRDITDIKQTEAALREGERRMRAILEANPDPIAMYDRRGFPAFINPAFTKVFGWTVEELKGSRIPFVPEDQKKLTKEKIDEIYEFERPVRFETTRLTKDGRVLDFLINASIVKGDGDEPAGMIVNLTDITERKILEAQFEQAQKMESLGTLAGGIAHDFNNLLGGIFGYVDLARKKTRDPGITEYLTKALNASERAEGLTHQLLTFSKGGAPVKKVESLIPFLQETAQFALSGANVSCTFNISDDLWACDFDRNQIGQVIDNVIINAHHAMPAGGNIVVTAANKTLEENNLVGLKPGNYVTISISDAGTGIPEKYISRIFDPFFTTKQAGSGLGLATAYSIIQKHDGNIIADSQPGTGTTFHITIPASTSRISEKEPPSREFYEGSGTILIMDDDEMLQVMLQDMLEDMGFEVTVTTDGRQALEALAAAQKTDSPFVAAILDLTIRGGMGGKETILEIRKLDSEIPVFVASGYSEDDAVANPSEFGFTDSLKKPFGTEQLTQVFEKHLS